MEPAAPAGGEYPKKKAPLSPRSSIEGETLEFYPGESYLMPKYVQVKACNWSQTLTTVIKPSSGDIDYKVENGQLSIKTNK